MVPSENAEAAGIVWDRFVKAKLGREIRDRLLNRGARPRFSVGVLAGEIISIGVVHLLELAQKIFVLQNLDQPGLTGELEHSDWVVIRPVPQLRVEVAEEAPRRRLP